MCGIAGILAPAGDPDQSVIHHRDIRSMTKTLAHRGADGENFWNDASHRVFLGHRRLAVIDTSTAAAQPMTRQGRFTMVYNGEIYNYLELRLQLQQLGHHFYTASDTEVILTAYAQYGSNCLGYFDGMFAIAIWDEQASTLFLARDRFGEKPLFFHEAPDGRFLFASEIKALWAAGAPRNMREDLLLLYLSSGLSSFPLDDSGTSYKDIFQVPAAHFMVLPWQDRRMASPEAGIHTLPQATRYWDIDSSRQEPLNATAAVEKFRELLVDSVQKRLRSDIAVGASLSGGVDSSSIAAIVSGFPGFQTFSAVFPGYEKDEKQRIDAVSSHLALVNHQVSPTAADLSSLLDTVLWHQEQPIVSASVVVQFQVMELARQHGITVLLDGQGADELLAGYDNYLHWFLQEQWRAGRWKLCRRERKLFRAHGWKQDWNWKNYLAALFPQVAQEQLMKGLHRQVTRTPFLDPGYAAAYFPPEMIYKPLVTRLNDILYYDMTMGRLPELLRYADRNSMAHGREVRLPFLQPDLVDFVFSLPPSHKIHDGFTKQILRKAMESRLPREVCWQKRKIGYEPPEQQWLDSNTMVERLQESRRILVKKGILLPRVLDSPPAPQGMTGSPARNTGSLNKTGNAWRTLVLAALSS